MSIETAFSALFKPINIGNMTVKNRIAMAPMGTGFFTEDGLVTERAKNYYEARARGGAGLVIVENTSVDFYRAMSHPNRPAIDKELALPGLTELSHVIKKHGARAIIQLNHTGKNAKSKLGGFQPVAASPIPYPGGHSPQGEIPRELTIEEIHQIVNLFAAAADRAKRAGFEGIEVHAAHAYLIAEFLSPFSNKRLDGYGGSIENRARILIEIVAGIRKSVGREYPLWCRINGREYGIKDGFTLDEAKAIAVKLNDIVDAIHVSAYGYGHSSNINTPDSPGELLTLAAEIKKVVSVPVIAVGRLSPEMGEQALKEGKADIIAIGRGLVADPELPRKVISGRLEDIRPCIACHHCADVRLSKTNSMECAVNAAAGREGEYRIIGAQQHKRIIIIGGGPAGMEAARVLTLRGHEVVLFEKEDHLGGQMSLAMIPPHKRDRIEPLITYFVTQLDRLGVEIRLNTEANVEIIRNLNSNVAILAAGATPIVPQLPGIEQANVATAVDILADRAEAGRKVVIIGGGSTGCETAEFLFEKGKEVTVVEMLPDLAVDMGFRDRSKLLDRITELPISFITKAMCSEIHKDGLTVIDREQKNLFISADTVVLAAGSKPNNSLFFLLRAKGFETFLAGDCWRLERIAGAISDGFRLGCVL
ncbi:FAD-dependent oxidoreductase [Chloroflexota bacterium]